MKKNKTYTLLIWLVITLIVGIVGWAIRGYVVDRNSFLKNESRMDALAQELFQAGKVNNTESKHYCEYNHMKYSRGSLGCWTEYSFSSNQNITKEIEGKLAKIGWQYSFDNTDSINKYGSTWRYQLHKVYKAGKLTCDFGVIQDGDKLFYKLGCGGPAKRAWYPLKAN